MDDWHLEFRRDGVLLSRPGAEVLLDGKPAALFVYLAVEGTTSRRALAALLWPDSDTSRARANLRKLLSRLDAWRDALVDEDPLALRPDLVPAPRDLLPERLGFDEASPFEAWLAEAQELRRRDRVAWLRREVERFEDSGDADEALRAAEELLELDPSEASARDALALAGRLGNPHAGLRIFEDHKARLAREFDAEPDPTTEALARDLALTVGGDADALERLAAEGSRVHGADGAEALERLDAARPAWLAAWRRAVADRDAAALAGAADALADYLELRGEIHLAVTLLSQAQLALEPAGSPAERRAAGRLLIHLAWHEQRLGLAAASAHAERGLQLLSPRDASTYRARGLYALGLTLWARGDVAGARSRWDEAHELLEGAGDTLRSAFLHGNVAIAADALGETDRAMRHYRAAIERFRRHGDEVAAAPYLNNLGQLLVEAGELEDGIRLLERGIELARSHGQRATLAYLLDSRCRAAIAARQLTVARDALDEATELARSCSDRVLSAALLASDAKLAIVASDDADPALDPGLGLHKATEALRAAHELGLRPAQREALLLLAEALHTVGAGADGDRILASLAAEGGASAAAARERLGSRTATPAGDVDQLITALLG